MNEDDDDDSSLRLSLQPLGAKKVDKMIKKKEQLFKKIPSKEFVESVLKLFIPNGFQDIYYQFSRKMIIEKGIVEKLIDMKDQLKEYYMNCKHTKYLDEIDPKKSVTILRQLLRLYYYRVVSMEKYYNGQKYLLYKIESVEVEKEMHKKSLMMKTTCDPSVPRAMSEMEPRLSDLLPVKEKKEEKEEKKEGKKAKE